MSETYLGDGLYASFDGWQIKLRAPRGYEDHVVYLDEHAYSALLEFVASARSADAGLDSPAVVDNKTLAEQTARDLKGQLTASIEHEKKLSGSGEL